MSKRSANKFIPRVFHLKLGSAARASAWPPDHASNAMDRPLPRHPVWYGPSRYILLTAIIIALAISSWVLWGLGGGVSRVSAESLTLATVMRGPFNDYIAV